jgi:predicted ester cyclase
MSAESNKAIVRRFLTAFEADDEAAFNEVLSPDLVAYSHGRPGPQHREEPMQGIRMWNAAFRETRFTIEEQIAEGDKVASHVTMRSVHSGGDFMGLAPTGKEVVSNAVSIERIQDGKIVDRRVIADWTSLMQQLGVVPASA